MSTRRLLNARIVIPVACLCIVFVGTLSVFAVMWGVHTSPTCTLTHRTVETLPANQDRTTIGINERVVCTIDDWSDTDIKIDGESVTYESDSIGEVDWYTTGSGTVYPATGTITIYTAEESWTNTSETVYAEVHDSGEKASEVLFKSVTFSILVPSGAAPYGQPINLPYGTRGNNFIGAHSTFGIQALPNSVNFSRVQIREYFDYASWCLPWPDGIHTPERPAGTRGPIYPCNFSGVHNMFSDDSASGKRPISYLNDGNGYVDFQYNWEYPIQFYSSMADPNWWPFTASVQHRIFTGSTQSARVEWVDDGSSVGGEQGPYE